MTTPATACLRNAFAFGVRMVLTMMLSINIGADVHAAPLTNALDAEMKGALREEALTGAVWSLVDSDGQRLGATGVADADSGRAMRVDHRVHVGSVAKTVLAAGVLRLVSERRLSLETPVSELLPELQFDNPWAATHPVLVRHLLAHTSGLDNLRFWQVFSLRPTADTPLAAAFAGDPGMLRVRTPPGARFSYSNIGYGLLGMVIESVASERYERYLDNHLLRPLDMRGSTFGFVSQSGASADPLLAMGHFEDGVGHPAVPMYLRPASQFTTTAADMARFAGFLIGDGTVNGRPFIDRSLLMQLARPHATEAARAGLLSVGHGLGLAMRDRHGVVGQCHPGTTVGFRAMLCLFPEQGKAFFVAINADSETADYERFNALLIGALDVERSTPVMPTAHAENLTDWDGIYVPAPNGMSTMAWIDTALNFVHVSTREGRLRIKPFQSDERWLLADGGGLLRASDRTTPSHVLLQSSDGQRLLSDGLHTWERASRWRMGLLWASLVAGLLGLVYILVAGSARALAGGLPWRSMPLLAPLLSIIALALPIPFFLQQSFLQLGDVTPATLLLAFVTGLLPVALIVGIIMAFRRRAPRTRDHLDLVAMLGVLQWLLVLAAWHLWPIRLWAL